MVAAEALEQDSAWVTSALVRVPTKRLARALRRASALVRERETVQGGGRGFVFCLPPTVGSVQISPLLVGYVVRRRPKVQHRPQPRVTSTSLRAESDCSSSMTTSPPARFQRYLSGFEYGRLPLPGAMAGTGE